MAQAKTRASTRKSRTKSTNKSKPSSRSRSSATKSNGAARVDSARRAVEHTAKEAGHSVGRAASKAKLPLVAGGAALAGAAGGLAVGLRQGRRGKGIGKVITRRPQVKVRSRDLAHAVEEVGSFGAQMGRLASELQNAREANSTHRSPIEVVLEGLTARRSRA